MKDLSKQIRESIRDKKRSKRQQKIQRIQRNEEHIPGIKSANRRTLITKIKHAKGEVITSKKGIANVFGEFNRKLSDDNQHDETEMESDKNETEDNVEDQGTNVTEMTEFPEITTEELLAAINRLQKRHISRQQRNQSRRHHSMRRRNKKW